jgi:hypothetical protein
MMRKILTYFLLTSLIFTQNLIQTSQTTKLANALRLTKALTAAAKAKTSTLTITSSRPGFFTGTACTNGPFVTTPTTAVVINPTTPLSCAIPLTSINIGLTDYTATTYYAFAFTVANLSISDPIQVTINITGTASTPVASATITNSSGTVLAASSSTDTGAASLPAGTVFAYANIGFNNTQTSSNNNATSTYANWIPLATQNSVLYTQSSTVVLPTGAYSNFTAPVVKTTTVLKPQTPPSGTATTGTFVATPTTPTTTGMPALSCATLLTDIYVTLTNTAQTASYIFHFDSSVMGATTIKTLATSGMYVTINVTQASTANAIPVATVILTDSAGNVYASSSSSDPNAAALTSNAEFDYAFVGFNYQNTLSAAPAGMTFANFIPLASQNSVLYKQGTTQVLPTPNYARLTASSALIALKPLNPPAYSPVGSQLPAGTFIATPATPTTTGMPALSCATSLTDIYVMLTNIAQSAYYTFHFDGTVINTQTIQALATSGVYVTINVTQASTANAIPVATVILTDTKGNVYASSSSSDTGSYPLVSNVEFDYAHIGFNYTQTLDAPPTGFTYANWIPLKTTNSVLYQTQNKQVLPTGGFATLRTISSVKLLSPIFPPFTSSAAGWSSTTAAQCNAPWVKNPTPGYNSVQVQQAINATTPLSCATNLTAIFVALTDTHATNYLTFTFDFSSMEATSNILPTLAAQGLYIYISQFQANNSANLVQISLCDLKGNLFAYSQSQPLATGVGFTYANIGFNMPNSLQTISTTNPASIATTTQNITYFNWLPIAQGSPVLYQQQTTQVLPTGAYASTTLPTT